jgi:hypothetical protein
MLAGMTEGDLAEQQEDLALCEAMIAEIEADLAAESDRDTNHDYNNRDS